MSFGLPFRYFRCAFENVASNRIQLACLAGHMGDKSNCFSLTCPPHTSRGNVLHKVEMLSTSSQLPLVVFMSTLHNLHLDEWTENLRTNLQKTRWKFGSYWSSAAAAVMTQSAPSPSKHQRCSIILCQKRHILYDMTLLKLYNSSSTIFL